MSNPVKIRLEAEGQEQAAQALRQVTGGMQEMASAGQKASAQTQAAGGALGNLESITRRVGVALAAAFSMRAIAQHAMDALDYAENMGKLSQKTGLAVETVSQLSHAAYMCDVSLEGLQMGVKTLSEWMVKNGQSGRDVLSVLMEMSSEFEAMPDGAEKTALAISRFGRAGMDMIPFLNQGPQKLRELFSEGRRYNLITAEQSEKANIFNDSLKRLWITIKDTYSYAVTNDIIMYIPKKLLGFTTWMASARAQINDFLLDYRTMMYMLTGDQGQLDKYTKTFNEQTLGRGTPASPKKAAVEPAYTRPQLIRDLIQKDVDAHRELANLRVDIDRQVAEARFQNDRAALDRLLETQRIDLEEYEAERMGLLEREHTAQMSYLRFQERELERKLRLEDNYGEKVKLRAAIEENAGQQRLENLEQQKRLLELQVEIERERKRQDVDIPMPTPTATYKEIPTFHSELGRGVDQLSDSWGNLGANAASVSLEAMQQGVATLSQGIGDAIDRTNNWGQLWQQLGKTVRNSLIQIFTEWIMKELLLDRIKDMMSAKEKVRNIQETVSKAPNALLESIKSYGVAAIIGGAVFAATMAMSGGFAEGGYTGDGGRYEPAGTVHRGEYVFSQPDVSRIGLADIERFRATGESAAGAGGQGGGKSGVNVLVIPVLDPDEVLNVVTSHPDYEARVVRMTARNKAKMGIPS